MSGKLNIYETVTTEAKAELLKRSEQVRKLFDEVAGRSVKRGAKYLNSIAPVNKGRRRPGSKPIRGSYKPEKQYNKYRIKQENQGNKQHWLDVGHRYRTRNGTVYKDSPHKGIFTAGKRSIDSDFISEFERAFKDL